MTGRRAVAGAAFSLAVTLGAAQSFAEGLTPYVGAKIGAGLTQTEDFTFDNPRLVSPIGDDSSDVVPMFAVSGGAAVTGLPLRFELELALRGRSEATRDDNMFSGIPFTARQAVKVQSTSAMVHGFYDLQTGTRYTPFVTGGVGISRNRATARQTAPALNWDERFTGDTKMEFAWSAGAGLGVRLAEATSLDIGYRFVDLGDWSAGDMPLTGDEALTGELRSHELYVGLRYSF